MGIQIEQARCTKWAFDAAVALAERGFDMLTDHIFEAG